MTLIINGFEIKDVPVKSTGIVFDKDGKKEKYVDSEGKQVKKMKIQGSEFVWVYDDGSTCDGKTFKAINGKPVKPFTRSTVIKSFQRIELSKMKYFINNDLTYLLISSEFKEWLKEQKAITFKFVNRGFKVYNAVAYYDGELDRSIMRCYQGNLLKTDLTEIEDVKEIEEKVEGLELDALEV